MKKMAIFETLSTLGGLDFLNAGNAKRLDDIYYIKYSDRTLCSSIASLSVEEIANQLKVLYADKWNNYLKNDANFQKILEKGNQNNVSSTDKGYKKITTNKVSAYNTDDYNEDYELTDSYIPNGDNVRTTSTMNVVTLNQINSYLNNSNFYDKIYKDVNNYLTLLVN